MRLDLAAVYDLPFFKEERFARRKCAACGAHFWSIDAKRTLCGDPPCVEYQFLGHPISHKKYDLQGMRSRFLGFLEHKGHTRVERAPVAARWRDDIYLSIASIAVFQPHVTSGLVPPPANPLAISQPCIRLNDVDSVGRSGRHLTTFEMMAHHVFNYPEGHPFHDPATKDKLYFKDRTTRLCQEFLTKGLGVDGASVTYKEKPWAGGGNAGPAFEVLTHGLEVATLVFMMWEADPKGAVDLYGDTYREMATKIVDTGYGLERFVWASQGTPTIYEAVMPEAVKHLKAEADLQGLDDERWSRILAEHAKVAGLLEVDTGGKLAAARAEVCKRLSGRGIEVTPAELATRLAPLEAVYAVADHTRCLTFMLGDGIVPSNVEAGYLARLMIRKSLRLLDEAALDLSLFDVVEKHLAALGPDFPELARARGYMRDVLETETGRYRDTLERGRRMAAGRAKKAGAGGTIPVDDLILLYDSHGLPPEVVREAAAGEGVAVEVPDDFYTRVAARHGKATKEKAAAVAPPPKDIKPTRLLYYEKGSESAFDATVVWADASRVVLDRTLFYPEGGGQPADHGVVMADGEAHIVTDVQKWGHVVVHTLDGGIRTGAKVTGRVDFGRRMDLTRNHSATHVIGGAARRVLGAHIWQAGAQKGVKRSRLDITHFRRISDAELRQIELMANNVVLQRLPIEARFYKREEADKKFGMVLYQGGVPPSRDVRVVSVAGFDDQACGGTHVSNTGELGVIKVFRGERIADGVERIEFAAGLQALNEVQRRDEILKAAAETLGVGIDELPQTVARFLDEWKQQRKELDTLRAASGEQFLRRLVEGAPLVGGVRVVVGRFPGDASAAQKAAGEIIREGHTIVALGGVDGDKAFVLLARSKDVAADLRPVGKDVGTVLGGGGGGPPDFVRAGGTKLEAVDPALETARAALSRLLGGG